jgi:hypothetical protein
MNMTLIPQEREGRVSRNGGHFLLSRGLHLLKRNPLKRDPLKRMASE